MATELSTEPGAPGPLDDASQKQNRAFFVFNAVLSVGALSFLAWLLLLNEGDAVSSELAFLPALNAGLNSLSAALLVSGWVAIKKKRPRIHRYFMVGAFAASALFLVSYVIHHYLHGDTRFGGEGAIRVVYLVVLASHVILSMGVVPMALSAFWFAYRRRFETHKKITRVLTPIWLYVSVTGVVIFAMLKAFPS